MKHGSKILFDPVIVSKEEIYKLIKDNPKCNLEKKFIERLWKKCKTYLDPDFPTAIAQEFNQHFWELYLTCSLLDKNYKLFSKNKSIGPDICFKNGKQKVWVEAIMPKGGNGSDSLPNTTCCGEYGYYIPEDKILLRYTSAISEKYRKYKEYINKKCISSNDPYVIAINGRGVPDAFLEDEIPYFIQAVWPIGNFQTTLEVNSLKVIKEGFSHKPNIKKCSGVQIDTSLFDSKKYEGISGIISSMVNIGNKPDQLGEDFKFFHNPKAINPLPKGWFKFKEEFLVENGVLTKYSL